MRNRRHTDLESSEIAIYMIFLSLVVIVGMRVLIYQCKRLFSILRENKQRRRPTDKKEKGPATTVDERVQQMKAWQGEVREAATKTQENLQQEIASVAQMQQEVNAQLEMLKSVLVRLEEADPPPTTADTSPQKNETDKKLE